MKQNNTAYRKIGFKPITYEKIFEFFGPQATLDEIREAASRICRDYLNGKWKSVSADQLIVKRISGGLSNFLYYVSLPQEAHAANEILATSSTTTNVPPPSTDLLNDNCYFSDDLLLGNALNDGARGDCNGNKRRRFDSSSSLGLPPREKEPNEVLLRIYGQSHGEDALEGMITESVVFALLSERNFGPKLHGIFPGGRIEQYIPARALLTTELSDPKISLKVAERMAEIHSLNIPMSKEPDWLWNCMYRWQRLVPAILARTDWKECQQEHVKFARTFDFTEEVKWLKSVIRKANYPVLFCHNDLQEGNILLRKCTGEDGESNGSIRDSLSSLRSNLEDSVLDNDDVQQGAAKKKRSKPSPENFMDSSADSALSHTLDNTNNTTSSNLEPDLMIIDFEYCAYNYRGFDLANHFLEWTFDYSNPELPNYYFRKEHFPSKAQREQFIVAYLKKLYEFDVGSDWEPSTEEIEGIEQEVELFKMFSHLFWSLWSVVNATSTIEFGYWDYGICRIKEYLSLKQQFLTNRDDKK